jgi:hypothetical protein
MADEALLAQAVAEGVNLKAAGVDGPSDAPEVRAQVTPGMQPGDATAINGQNAQLDRPAPTANDNQPKR